MGRERVFTAVWKEKLTLRQSIAAAQAIEQLTQGETWPFAIALAPNPFSFAGVAQALAGESIRLCSQNVLWLPQGGSYIGETTTDMLLEIGCDYVIVGHSERRLHFEETNEMIANRGIAAIDAGMRPILCVGETAEERAEGRSKQVLTTQLESFLERIPDSLGPDGFLIAYEPVWAISTWRSDQPLPNGAEVQALHVFIRELIAGLRNDGFAAEVPLLYGGSVAPDNAEEYMAQADVDGALVGGASKTPESFHNTLLAARKGFARKDG